MASNRRHSLTKRRNVLKAGGTAAVLLGLSGTQLSASARGNDELRIAVKQGETCTQVTPLDGETEIVEAYGYVEDADAQNSRQSNLPSQLEESQTSRLFFYDGPKGLSLVFVQGGNDDPGGAATALVCGLPIDGDWVVLDDSYDGATDEFQIGAQEAVLNWAWGSSGRNDGAVFRGFGDEFCVSIKSMFGDEAKLDPFGDGAGVTAWQFLTGDIEDPDVVELDRDKQLSIHTGSCEDTPDGCTMTTVNSGDSLDAEVTFCCRTVTVTAESYDTVRLNFLNGTDQRFEGPFEGTNGFSATDDGDSNLREDIIRSVVVESKDDRKTVENPNFRQCIDIVEQRAEPDDKDEPQGS